MRLDQDLNPIALREGFDDLEDQFDRFFRRERQRDENTTRARALARPGVADEILVADGRAFDDELSRKTFPNEDVTEERPIDDDAIGEQEECE